jgi:hypothetical protein
VTDFTRLRTSGLQKNEQAPLLAAQAISSFISGRCISNKFVYTTDLLHCCPKTRGPITVIKLSAYHPWSPWIPPRSCWIYDTLTTRKVVLNGILDPWIICKNGLGQGDSLSSYIFNIVPNGYQKLISQSFSLAYLAHPIAPNLYCLVHQYIYGNLTLAPATPKAAAHLHSILNEESTKNTTKNAINLFFTRSGPYLTRKFRALLIFKYPSQFSPAYMTICWFE